MKHINEYNVIVEDYNNKEFVSYDVMPYLMRCYDETKKKDKPKTFEEFKEFVRSKSMYQYWCRCEYEIVLNSLFSGRTKEEKIDVYFQISLNIDVVTKLLMDNVNK